MLRSTKLLLLAATALAPVPGLAQAVPPATGAAGDAVPGEIIVTARKRAESLQEVPLAITAFDSAEIKSARIESLADLGKLTPGLNYTPLFGAQNQLPIIRGAAQTLGQLNVGVFLDGIYLSGKAGVDLELNDLERVEVVKGPQSALYGRNTFAGAINYVTKRPSDRLSFNGEVTGGGESLFKAQASVSGAVADGVRVRVGGYYKSFDGFYTSAIDGGRVDFQKSYGGIATVELQPSEAFTATLRFSYAKDDDGQPPSSVIRNNSAPGTPAGSSIPGVFTPTRNLIYMGVVPEIGRNAVTVNTRPVPGLPGGSYGDREENIRASATLEYAFDGAVLTSITAFDKRNAEYTFDGDNTICDRLDVKTGCPNFGYSFAPAIPLGKSDFALSSNIGYSRDVSQELRVASSGKHPVDWLVGAFYYDNISPGTDRGITLPGTLAITDYSTGAANYKYPKTTLGTSSYSVFASATWHVGDRFDLTGELRYEHEKQTFRQIFLNPTGPNGPAAVRAPSSQTFKFATPRVIANYKASDDVLVYASYARGAKTGGFNTGLNILNNYAYRPEYSNNYEVGLKSELFDRRLRFNVAGYYDDWQDQQAACQAPVSAGGSSTNRTYTCNVAASHIYGLEIEADARFADWFSLGANYAYTHARYTRFIDDSLAQTLALAKLPAISFDGKHLPYVPDHKFVVSPKISVPLGTDVKLSLRADVAYQSESFVRADNFQRFDSKTTVDLRANLNYRNFSLQVFANNVFDNAAPVAAVRFFDSTNYSVSSPLVTGAQRRLIGATLAYRY